MSVDITRAFVEEYAANVFILSQQKYSRFEMCVETDSGIIGASKNVERIGVTTAQLKSVRHADTPITDIPHSRRVLPLADYEHAALIDDLDKVKMLIDPQSPYVMAGVMAMNRAKDDVIIAALTGSAGIQDGGSTALPSAQKIAVNATSLTMVKLRAAKQLFDEAEVDEDEERYMAVSADQLNALLALTEVTSSDYNTVKALVEGKVDTFMGFNFVRSERLNKVGNDRFCPAWAKSGLRLGIGSDVKSRVDERPDKSYATQVYGSMSIGAVRMEEKQVIEIAYQ